MTHRLVRNAAYLLMAEAVTKIFGIALIVVLARHLGAAGFGTYSFVLAVAFMSGGFIDFGTSLAYVSRIAAAKELTAPYLQSILPLKSLLGGATLLVLLVVAIPLHRGVGPVVLAGLFVALEMTNESLKVVFRAHERLGFEAASQALQRVTLFFAIVIGVAGGAGLNGILFLYAASAAVGLLWTLRFVRQFGKPGFRFDPQRWVQFLQAGLPYFLLGFFVLVYYRIDTFMLGLMKTDREVGFYAAAYQFVLALGFVPSILVRTVLPRFATLADSPQVRRALYRRLLYLCMGGGAVISILIGIAAVPLVDILYGPSFAPSVAVLRVVIGSFFLICSSTVTSYFVMVLGHESYAAKVAAFGAVVNLLLNLALIPRFGIMGAAAATVATEAVMFGFFARKAAILLGEEGAALSSEG